MSWLKYHSESEKLASAAEMSAKEGNVQEAHELYRLAAHAEMHALVEIKPRKTRTIGITAVSAAALYYKAGDYQMAEDIAKRWLNNPSIPQFAADQLIDIVQKAKHRSRNHERSESASPKNVTIIVDSGCFLHREGTQCDIGYFQGKPSAPDITVRAEGRMLPSASLINLGAGSCLVEIQHRNADGTARTDGIKIPVPFHDELLHFKDLYGRHVPVERKNFDFILRFRSGEFGVADVREHSFNRFKKLASGKLSARPEEKIHLGPIAHDIIVRFTLADGESIVFTKNGAALWSSDQVDVKRNLEIKINADDSTTEKFYRRSLKAERNSYWMPSPSDPPPISSMSG